ncbi:UNVERIFIED_CONTAM: hypothetical protein K2H54_013675 [Gekko kuhli]
MYPLQFFMALVVGTSLRCAAASGVTRPEANTCTVLACGTPGRDGLPGRDGAKGEKGDQGTDTLQRQVDALENKILALQTQFNNYKNAVLLQGLKVGQKTFISTHQRDTYTSGKAQCVKAGGTLACPKNAAENSALHELALKDGKLAFIDVTDIQREGKFMYANGEPVSYTNWKEGEPNNANGIEDCVIMFPESGLWNDWNCDATELIICEF